MSTTNNILVNNLKVIEQRWPDMRKKFDVVDLNTLSIEVESNTLIVNGVQLTSNYDRIAEAEMQAQLIPMDSKVASVYGVGLGDLCQVLLARTKLEKLHVHILNTGLFLHVLNAIDHTCWLTDERVMLVSASEMNEVNLPFAAVPAELELADNSSAQLRDRVVLELDNEFISRLHRDDHILFKASINSNMAFIQQDASIDELILSNMTSVYIAAAGPTLSEHFLRLQQNQASDKAKTLIAVDAAVKPLLNHNIIPDIVVSADHAAQLTLVGVDLAKLKNSALVYFPRISPELIKNWPSKRFCVYSSGPLYKELDKKYPKEKLFVSGSVIHPAIDLAVLKGATEIVLLGADFGFPNNQTHATGQTIFNSEHYAASSYWVLNGKGERISTMLNYRGYLRDLERYIQTQPQVNFINGSVEGAKIAGTLPLSGL